MGPAGGQKCGWGGGLVGRQISFGVNPWGAGTVCYRPRVLPPADPRAGPGAPAATNSPPAVSPARGLRFPAPPPTIQLDVALPQALGTHRIPNELAEGTPGWPLPPAVTAVRPPPPPLLAVSSPSRAGPGASLPPGPPPPPRPPEPASAGPAHPAASPPAPRGHVSVWAPPHPASRTKHRRLPGTARGDEEG